eukprot:5258441-Pyramimonas_sp.AAC.1
MVLRRFAGPPVPITARMYSKPRSSTWTQCGLRKESAGGLRSRVIRLCEISTVNSDVVRVGCRALAGEARVAFRGRVGGRRSALRRNVPTERSLASLPGSLPRELSLSGIPH